MQTNIAANGFAQRLARWFSAAARHRRTAHLGAASELSGVRGLFRALAS